MLDYRMCEYYSERATDGGLLISEAVYAFVVFEAFRRADLLLLGSPVSLVASGMLGVAGMWLPEQVQGWKKVTDSIHAKGGKVFAQRGSSSLRRAIAEHRKLTFCLRSLASGSQLALYRLGGAARFLLRRPHHRLPSRLGWPSHRALRGSSRSHRRGDCHYPGRLYSLRSRRCYRGWIRRC